MNNFIKFLVKAKKKTYASNGEFGERKLKDGAKELIFKENNFYYRDRYYGSKIFIGEEVVLKDNKPFWIMNYFGGCLSDNCPSSKIYVFLKKCLKKVNTNTIFRGPEKFKINYFVYKNKIKGDVKNFYGEEFIYYKNKKVYKLNYHGGLIE